MNNIDQTSRFAEIASALYNNLVKGGSGKFLITVTPNMFTNQRFYGFYFDMNISHFSSPEETICISQVHLSHDIDKNALRFTVNTESELDNVDSVEISKKIEDGRCVSFVVKKIVEAIEKSVDLVIW